ncbi:hypothetical protein D3C71_1682210 [compost metagenome]
MLRLAQGVPFLQRPAPHVIPRLDPDDPVGSSRPQKGGQAGPAAEIDDKAGSCAQVACQQFGNYRRRFRPVPVVFFLKTLESLDIGIQISFGDHGFTLRFFMTYNYCSILLPRL